MERNRRVNLIKFSIFVIVIIIIVKIVSSPVTYDIFVNKKNLRKPIFQSTYDLKSDTISIGNLYTKYRGNYYIHISLKGKDGITENRLFDNDLIFECIATQEKEAIYYNLKLLLKKGYDGSSQYFFSSPKNIKLKKPFRLEVNLPLFSEDIKSYYESCSISIYRESSLWR